MDVNDCLVMYFLLGSMRVYEILGTMADLGIQGWITLGPTLKELMTQTNTKIVTEKLLFKEISAMGGKKTEMRIAIEIIKFNYL